LIVIIGGTSGIGLETAKYFCSKKKKVLVGGRNQSNDKELAYKYIDVSNEKSIKTFFEDIDHIDGLVYSSGITTKQKSITEFEQDIWENIVNVNVTGALLVLKYAYEKLVNTKGKIVIINSLATRTFSAFSGVEYTMSKNALSGMVKQLSIDFAKDGVIINSVFPSMTATPMLIENVEKEKLDNIANDIPLKRISKPIEVAKAIEFLLSEDNSYMTGSGLDLNGGQFLNG
jgi:3-oxoacyl-[acyl-carrier protein] reductase